MKSYTAKLILIIVLLTSEAIATPRPDQIAVIANGNSQESLAVARHYLARRRIPKDNLFVLNLPSSETMSRTEYDTQLVGPLRKKISERGLAPVVRVLLTTFDVPLRVAAPEVEGEEKQHALDALTKIRLARAALVQSAEFVSGVARKEGEEAQFQIPEGSENPKEILDLVEKEIRSAVERANGIEDAKLKADAMNKIGAAVKRVSGFAGIANTLKPSNDGSNPNAAEMLEKLKQQVTSAQQMIKQLEQLPNERNRNRGYVLTERTHGLAGVMARALQESQMLKYEAADASVDSELSLLWWDKDMYPLQGRVGNPYYLGIPQDKIASLAPIPVLMVSRLDGPTAEIASALVDKAIEAEQSGLKGRAYFDARGLKLKSSDALSVFDQDIRDLGWKIRENTGYKTVIDNNDGLLPEAHNTAIYTGWYSVGKFVGDFSFTTGAIGYHIASSEALSVRDSEEKGWCKNLLERGITATLGPVNEPYLESFPLPEEFFGLLMSGKYSLVEAYYLSSKFVGWRMVLFGDPLYNPWKSKPALSEKLVKVPSRAKEKLDTLPRPISELSFTDPMAVRAKIDERKMTLQKRFDDFFAKLQSEQASASN